MPQVRPYRGIDAAERLAQRRARLIDAGLEILGAAPPAPELTVRTICGGAGVAMRYFYESFTDRDDFVRAVRRQGVHAADEAPAGAAVPVVFVEHGCDGRPAAGPLSCWTGSGSRNQSAACANTHTSFPGACANG